MVLRNLLHHDRPIVLDRAEVWLVSGPFIRRSRGDVVGKIVAVPRVHHLGLVSRRAVVLERPLLLVHRIEDDLSLGLHLLQHGEVLFGAEVARVELELCFLCSRDSSPRP